MDSGSIDRAINWLRWPSHVADVAAWIKLYCSELLERLDSAGCELFVE